MFSPITPASTITTLNLFAINNAPIPNNNKIKHLTIQNNTINDLSFLTNFNKLEYITFDTLQLNTSITILSTLPNLHTIKFRKCSIHPNNLLILSQCTKLKKLEITTRCDINKFSSLHFTHLKHLTITTPKNTLPIRTTNCYRLLRPTSSMNTRSFHLSVFNNCPNLRTIILKNTYPQPLYIKKIIYITPLIYNLRHLTIKNYVILQITNLTTIKSLRSINIQKCGYDRRGFEHFKQTNTNVIIKHNKNTFPL